MQNLLAVKGVHIVVLTMCVLVNSSYHNKIPQAWWLNNRNLFSHSPRVWKFTIKVPTQLSSQDAGLQTAALLCLHLAFLWCVHSWYYYFFNDISPIRLGLHS